MVTRSRARGREIVHADVRIWGLAIALIALIARLPLMLNDVTSAITPDSPLYVQIAEDLLAGRGLETDAYRTWGYPLFIAPLTVLPGSTTSAIVVTQHVLGVALAAAVFFFSDRYFGRLVGLLAAALAALAPPMVLI